MKVALTLLVVVLSGTGLATGGEIVSDGDLDDLIVGSAPDCDSAAGAWGWPQNYLDTLLCEVDPDELSIVATGDFDPGAEGNSLRGLIDDSAGLNFHLPLVFNEVIDEAEDLIVTVSFDIWVIDDGAAGGHVYVGGDHGGGGFSNATDRGPQLSWASDGTLAAAEWAGEGLPPTLVVLADYTPGEWQSVRMEIDLITDTFDLFWGPPGALEEIGTDLGYRVEALDHMDRFTVVHFGLTEPNDHMYVDNVAVVIGGEECEGDANGDGLVDPLDSGFVLARFGCEVGGGDPSCDTADQNGDGMVDPLDVGFVLARFGPCDSPPLMGPLPQPAELRPIRSDADQAGY